MIVSRYLLCCFLKHRPWNCSIYFLSQSFSLRMAESLRLSNCVYFTKFGEMLLTPKLLLAIFLGKMRECSINQVAPSYLLLSSSMPIMGLLPHPSTHHASLRRAPSQVCGGGQRAASWAATPCEVCLSPRPDGLGWKCHARRWWVHDDLGYMSFVLDLIEVEWSEMALKSYFNSYFFLYAY